MRDELSEDPLSRKRHDDARALSTPCTLKTNPVVKKAPVQPMRLSRRFAWQESLYRGSAQTREVPLERKRRVIFPVVRINGNSCFIATFFPKLPLSSAALWWGGHDGTAYANRPGDG